MRTHDFLSQNSYLNGLKCQKFAWEYKHARDNFPKLEKATASLFDYGHMIGDKAQELYTNGILACENEMPFSDYLIHCKELLEKRVPIFELGLMFKNLYAQSDILNPVGDDQWDLIEVKSGRAIADVNYHDVAFQRYVYLNAGININRCFIMHVIPGSKAGQNCNAKDIFQLVDVTDKLPAYSAIVEDSICQLLETWKQDKSPNICPGKQCSKPYKCRLYDICNKKDKEVKVTVLGSGSKGNSIVIESAKSAIMIDAGFDAPEILSKLASAQIAKNKISSLFITHEHSDHIKGAKELSENLSIPVYLHNNVFTKSKWVNLDAAQVSLFRQWDKIDVADFIVTPIPVLHDTIAPVGYIVECKSSGEKISIVTDAGFLQEPAIKAMKNSDIIMLESNHDIKTLHNSQRPDFLKDRIAGYKGHLSNNQCGYVLSQIVGKRTSEIILLHRSEDCNTEELAANYANNVLKKLGRCDINLQVAKQYEPISI